MKYLLQKDIKKRKSFYRNENRFLSIKFLERCEGKNENFVFHLKNKNIALHTEQFGRTFSKNRCIFTNRSRSIIRNGKVSRIKFRSYASFGYMTGINKSTF